MDPINRAVDEFFEHVRSHRRSDPALARAIRMVIDEHGMEEVELRVTNQKTGKSHMVKNRRVGFLMEKLYALAIKGNFGAWKMLTDWRYGKIRRISRDGEWRQPDSKAAHDVEEKIAKAVKAV